MMASSGIHLESGWTGMAEGLALMRTCRECDGAVLQEERRKCFQVQYPPHRPGVLLASGFWNGHPCPWRVVVDKRSLDKAAHVLSFSPSPTVPNTVSLPNLGSSIAD